MSREPIRTEEYSFHSINRDMAVEDRPKNMHFDVVNMDTYFTNKSKSIKVSKGTGSGTLITAPGDVVNPNASYVIGELFINDRWFIFTTKNDHYGSGSINYDSLQEVIDTGTDPTLTVIFQGRYNFSTLAPITAVGNQEGSDTFKAYWVDGRNQARSVNISDPSTELDFLMEDSSVSSITAANSSFSAVEEAIVQYSFSMYNPSESSSKPSALTPPVTISPIQHGAQISITGLSSLYSVVRVYRIKYTSYGSAVSVDLIAERSYSVGETIELLDDGSLFISSIGVDSYFDIGSDLIIPSTIAYQKQHLFFGNIKLDPYTVEPQEDDTDDYRAYGYTSNNYGVVHVKDISGATTGYTNSSLIPLDHDCINPDYDTYKYRTDGTTVGLEGPNVLIGFDTTQYPEGLRLHKQGEIYRIGVQFKDNYNRWSNVLWVCDAKVPYTGYPTKITGQVKTMPASAKGVKFVMVERTEYDKTILMQCVPQFTMEHRTKSGSITYGTSPFPTMRTINGTNSWTGSAFDINQARAPGSHVDYPPDNDFTDIIIPNRNNVLLVGPDFVMNKKDLVGTHIRIVGSVPSNAQGSYMHFRDSYNDRTASAYVPPTSSDYPATRKPDYTGYYTSGQEAWVRSYCVLADFESPPSVELDLYRVSWMFNRECIKYMRPAPVNIEFTIDPEVKFLDYDGSIILGSTMIDNTVDYANFADKGDSKINLEFEGIAKYGIVVADSNWTGSPNYLGDNMNNFPTFNQSYGGKGDFPLVDVLNKDVVQYGGGSYEAKSSNIYIDSSPEGDGSSMLTMEGDTFMGLYSFAFSTGARKNLTQKHCAVYDYVHIYMESSIDPIEFNRKLKPSSTITANTFSNRRAIESKLYEEYNTVFSQPPTYNKAASVGFNRSLLTNYYTRVVPTDAKLPGELFDSWTEIRTGTFIDLDSILGPIVKLVRQADSLYAFQPKGIAEIKVYPTSQTSSSSGSVQLGKGTILDSYVYLKEGIGAINMQAICAIEEDIFYIDSLNKTLNSLKLGELSSMLGFNDVTQELMTEHTEVSGGFLYLNDSTTAHFVFADLSKKEIYFKFSNSFNVLVYNYKAKVFTHTRTYEAGWFGSDKASSYAGKNGRLFKLNSGAIGTYFQTTKASSIEMYVEPLPSKDVVYHSVVVLKEGDSNFDKIKIDSINRTSGTQDTNFKSKFDLHTTFFPRVENSFDKWRVRNIKVLLTYNAAISFVVDKLILKLTVKK